MSVLKNGLVVADPWQALADDAPAPVDGAVLVGLARWRRDRETLRASALRLGVRLAAAESPAAIAGDLGRLELVAIEFPAFTDGRGFSHARRLRERHGFRGELRAVGRLLCDQYAFLRRCGFDAVELTDAAAAAWIAAARRISVVYQPAADGVQAVVRRRMLAGAA